jgi:hypothetical protein
MGARACATFLKIENRRPIIGLGESSADRHWLLTPHDFLDLILTGGDTQAFWDEILIA